MKEPLHLLVVDDDPVDLMALEKKLARYPLLSVVHRAHSLEEARKALGERRFDCVLLDLHLRREEGLALLPTLGRVPAIVLTGLDDEASAQRALKLGAQDYVLKDGGSADEIMRAIQYGIERKRAELMATELQEVNHLSELGRLATSVAHEINNPNHFLQGNLLIVQDEIRQMVERDEPLDTAQLREMLDAISDCLESSQRIDHIVRRMLSYARRDEDATRYVPVSLNDVAQWGYAWQAPGLDQTPHSIGA